MQSKLKYERRETWAKKNDVVSLLAKDMFRIVLQWLLMLWKAFELLI